MKNINKNTMLIAFSALTCTLAMLMTYPFVEQQAYDYSIEYRNDISENERDREIQAMIFPKTFPLYYELKKQENPQLQPYDLFIDTKDKELPTQNAQALSDVIFNQLHILETDYKNLDYYIRDDTNDKTLIRGDETLLPQILEGSKPDERYDWYVALTFDQNGVLSIQNYHKENFSIRSLTEQFSTSTNNLFSSNNSITFSNYDNYGNYTDVERFRFSNDDTMYDMSTIKNTSFVFAMDEVGLDSIVPPVNYSSGDTYIYNSFIRTPFYAILTVLFIFLMIRKFTFDKPIPFYQHFRKIPAEIIFTILAYLLTGLYLGSFIFAVVNSEHIFLINGAVTSFFDYVYLYVIETFLLWFLIFAYFAYSFLMIKEMFTTGSWKYQFLGFRFLRWIKRKLIHYYTYASSFDLSNEDDKRIGATILINFVVLFCITLFWAFGVFFLIIYSFALFIIAKKYISKVRKDYRTMLDVTTRIASGDFDQSVEEDMGMFNAFKDDMANIRSGFKSAVEEEVHSQRMKTELISNVSHDLKTPLTSIITYVDLLKSQDLKDENSLKYIDTIDRNSIRLKRLIEDLFEISKANSGDIKIEKMDMDICSLMKQVQFELNDKLSAIQLDLRNNFSDEKIVCHLDPQKTYRILENLIANIGKYALPSTRVYIEITDYGNIVEVSLRNISATELNFDADDIIERFTRGDASRNTEGSGLGLAIARSFTEIQQGTLKVSIDGDLFKVVLRFPKNDKSI